MPFNGKRDPHTDRKMVVLQLEWREFGVWELFTVYFTY